MSLIFATEPLTQCWNEIVELGSAHWHETMEYYRDKQPFNPSFERYDSYAKAGWLVAFTVRDQGKMVGYGLMYVVPSMHTQSLIAVEDTMFILPEYRQGRNGLRLYEYVEQEMARRGVVEVIVTAKPGSAACRILEHLGCELINHQYSKHLAKPVDLVYRYTPVRADSLNTPINAVTKEVPHVCTITTPRS